MPVIFLDDQLILPTLNGNELRYHEMVNTTDGWRARNDSNPITEQMLGRLTVDHSATYADFGFPNQVQATAAQEVARQVQEAQNRQILPSRFLFPPMQQLPPSNSFSSPFPQFPNFNTPSIPPVLPPSGGYSFFNPPPPTEQPPRFTFPSAPFDTSTTQPEFPSSSAYSFLFNPTLPTQPPAQFTFPSPLFDTLTPLREQPAPSGFFQFEQPLETKQPSEVKRRPRENKNERGRGAEKEETTPKKRKRSVSRGVRSTIVPGFRFGVATWNLHGFQKSKDLTIDQCLDYRTPLAELARVNRLRVALTLYADRTFAFFGGEMRNTLASVAGQIQAHQAVYIDELCRKFQEFSGIDPASHIAAQPDHIANPTQAAEALKELIRVSERLLPKPMTRKPKEGAQAPKKKKKIKPPKPKPSEIQGWLNSVKGALLKRSATAALKWMFNLHTWLDAVVLQEVKYTGIGVLERLAAEDGFEIYRGPLIKGVSEVEFYPLALRKSCQSNNNLGQILKVVRIWWIKPDGGIGELHDVSLKKAAIETDVDFEESEDASSEVKDNVVPDVRWNKDSDSYRPVVVYDIEIGEGSGIIVHLGVTHTTPSKAQLKLSDEEKASLSKVLEKGNKRSRTRQGHLASNEFQRLNQFKQLEQALNSIASKAYASGEQIDRDYAGPWILAGDYYLFRESRVKDLSTSFNPDEDAFEKPMQERLLREFNDRLEKCTQCARDKYKYMARAQKLKVMSTRLESGDEADYNKVVLAALHEDNLLLANEFTSAEAGLRAVMRSHKSVWLTPSELVASLNRGELAEENAGNGLTLELRAHLRAHKRGLNYVLDARYQMYAELRRQSTRCMICRDELQSVDASNSIDVLAALRAQNQRWMKESLTPLPEPEEGKKKKTGKTVQNIAYNPQDDPIRNTVGISFQSMINENLEITQAVSGSNSNKFEKLSLLSADDRDYDREFQYHAMRVKVADFFINTRFDHIKRHGTNHWAAKVVGLMSPLEGRIMLADTEDLAVARFWAAVSDHFPVGAFYSTDCAVGEVDLLRDQVLTTLKEKTISESARQIEALDRSRRLDRLADLRKLALLKQPPSALPELEMAVDTEMAVDNDVPEQIHSATVALQAAETDTSQLSTRELDDLIENIEEWLDVHDDDRFGQLTLELADFEVKD